MTPDDEAECPTCGRSFSTRTRMERHAKSAHGSTPTSPRTKKVAAAVAGLALVAVGAALVTDGPGGSQTRAEALADLGADDDPFLGNESAPVAVVEFATPRCPACKSFHEREFPNVRSRFVDSGDVTFYYAQFTIGYSFDRPGGIAQECVKAHAGNEPFFEFTDLLYDRQGQTNEDNVDDTLRDFADANGHDGDALVSCYRNRDTRDAYEADVQAGKDHGVRGTPYFFVVGHDGDVTPTSGSSLEDVIRSKLESAGGD